MKAASDCYQCLHRLVHQAAELATCDTQLRTEAIDKGLQIVERNFSYDVTTITMATENHKAVKEITGNPDPYQGMKDEEIITLLHKIGPSTFFTRDLGFYSRGLCHASYSLICLAVNQYEAASFIRRIIRTPVFNIS